MIFQIEVRFSGLLLLFAILVLYIEHIFDFIENVMDKVKQKTQMSGEGENGTKRVHTYICTYVFIRETMY